MQHNPTVYITEHINSKVVGSAFAEGCGGRIASPVRLLDGPAVVYGILRGCGDIIRQAEWVGRDFFHIDLGYFKRGHYEGYYRVTQNAFQADLDDVLVRPDRWETLKIPLRPWKRTGRNVVVCPMTGAVGDFLNINTRKWIETVTDELRKYTERPIIVKPKGDVDISEMFEDAWCVVTHSSNAAVDAVLAGVPVVTLGDSACEQISWGLSDIESPFWPERDWWCHKLAYHQFTLDEFRNGVAWKILEEHDV
jgi:phosphohistidine swiveling domain-containing protein